MVCSPFEEHRYNWLPMCPVLAPDGKDLIRAAFVPDDATRDYTVIVVAVKVSNRSVACLKRFVSKGDEWSCSLVECAFQFLARSKLLTITVFSN